MTPLLEPGTRLHGAVLFLVRLIWIIFTVSMLTSFVLNVPVRFLQLSAVSDVVGPGGMSEYLGLSADVEAIALSRLGPAEAALLHAWSLPLDLYALYVTAFETALALVGAVMGLFLFWRRPDDWLVMWVSLLIILLGTGGKSPLISVALVPEWFAWVLSTLAGLVGMISIVHVLLISPDGQFVPRWTLAAAASCTAVILAGGLYTILLTPGERIGALLLFVFPIWLMGLGAGVFAQIYRYRRVSGPTQRQQTKWVAAGLAGACLGFAINGVFMALSLQPGYARLFANLTRSALVPVCFSALPICLGISTLRYRLWDIDLLIRRTLIYGALTAILGGLYLGSIVASQSVFAAVGGQRSELATVVSTLAIAALFFPLRNRVQAFIDKRFYRKKYDAARTLTARLVDIVQETMQPESIGVWLKATAKPSERDLK